ncbi:hepatoma-derived growth factor-related protein 2-like [Manduca sexta]|uniref:hepatoma-derived growth factor-related protein 2-like n=1 Tax=Manduca sexta TaxID=7130 RepID=UPI00188FF953|nr:hepatoma-derived growth factor-related protein 2-like [Manduca sexta]
MAPATVKTREKSAAPAKKPAPGSKPKKGGRKEPAVQPAPEPRPLPPAPASMETPWVEVARRKKKGKTTAAPTTTSVQPPKPSRRKEPKLRPPRSAAVVISLTPAAVAKGMTYKGVLTDAQNRVDLTGLDISRLKPKFTATGAPDLPSPVPESGAEEAEFGGRKPADGEVEKENTGAKPMEVATEFVRPPSLDSDSSGSGSTVRSKKLWRRNSRSRHSLSQFTSDTDEPAPKSQTTDSRGRGRPPSVGKYVGLRKAQLERDKLQREEAKKRADKELEDRLHFVKSPILPKASETEDEDRPVLREDLRQCVQVVRTTVRKSGNLKGTSQKALNWVTNKIARYVDQPESAVIALLESETKKWQENCARLEANMKTIQEENTALKRRLEELEAAAKGPSTEEMLAMVEARVQARMESILMGPAQRPPLAHEKKTTPIDVELPVSDGYVGGTHAKAEEGEKGKKGGEKDGPARSGSRSCSHYPRSHCWAFQRSAASRSGPFYSGGVDTCDGASNREKTREERRACKEAGTRLQAEEGRKKRAGSSTRAGAPSAAAGP